MVCLFFRKNVFHFSPFPFEPPNHQLTHPFSKPFHFSFFFKPPQLTHLTPILDPEAALVFCLVIFFLASTNAFLPPVDINVDQYVHNQELYADLLYKQTTEDLFVLAPFQHAYEQISQFHSKFGTLQEGESTQVLGKCRLFNDGDAAAVDAASKCVNMIDKGSNIFMLSALGSPEGQKATVDALYPLLGLANPNGCDHAVMTYFCKLVYSPCVTFEEPTGETESIQQPDGTVIDVPITETREFPLLPCKKEYKENTIYSLCPGIAALGIFEAPTFAFGDEGQCDTSLVPVGPWKADPSSSQGRVESYPHYSCPYPLVTVDPLTYPHSTLLGGPCTLPCPSFLQTQNERKWRDRWSMGWNIISQMMGYFLLFSYWILPNMRKRRYILIGLSCIMLQATFVMWPWFHQVVNNGYGSGFSAVCTGPASEVDGNNFLCGLQGWSSVISMYGSLLAVNFLALSLLEKIVLQGLIHLNEEQQKLRERIQSAACLAVPIIFSIVIHGYGQFTGNNALGSYCYITKARDVIDGPNLADGLGIIPAVILVFSALLQLLTVFGYLCYIRMKHNMAASALTWAQVRIMTLVIVMCSLYMGMFGFRYDMEYNLSPKLAVSIPEWITCMLTGAGTASVCGERPHDTILAGWINYNIWIISTGGFTFFFAIAYSNDILWGWAAFYYYYFGWEWLEPYAKKGEVDKLIESERKKQSRRTNRSTQGQEQSRTHSGGGNGNSRGGDSVTYAPSSPTHAPSSPAMSATKRPTLFKKSTFHSSQQHGPEIVELSGINNSPASPTDDLKNTEFSIGPSSKETDENQQEDQQGPVEMLVIHENDE